MEFVVIPVRVETHTRSLYSLVPVLSEDDTYVVQSVRSGSGGCSRCL